MVRSLSAKIRGGIEKNHPPRMLNSTTTTWRQLGGTEYGVRLGESVRLLCVEALDEMASGIEPIKRVYPLPTLEEREGAIEAAETLLQIAVLVGPFFPDEGDEIIHQIQLIVSLMKEENDENIYEQEIRAVGRSALHIQNIS